MFKWQETTLRKGTQTPKICRDMFVSRFHDEFKFCVVRNGKIYSKYVIRLGHALDLIDFYKLVGRDCSVFADAQTFRTKSSWHLIDQII